MIYRINGADIINSIGQLMSRSPNALRIRPMVHIEKYTNTTNNIAHDLNISFDSNISILHTKNWPKK